MACLQWSQKLGVSVYTGCSKTVNVYSISTTPEDLSMILLNLRRSDEELTDRRSLMLMLKLSDVQWRTCRLEIVGVGDNEGCRCLSIGTMPEHLSTGLQDFPKIVWCRSRSRDSYQSEIVDVNVNFFGILMKILPAGNCRFWCWYYRRSERACRPKIVDVDVDTIWGPMKNLPIGYRRCWC